MKKPTSKIREEIARLQEQLKQAETRDAERIGRLALRAGLGELDLEETQLLAAFEELAARFRGAAGKRTDAGRTSKATTLHPGETEGQIAEG
ncbi:conjugal transfer protein TraC [Peteryoungia ipomoeae]|uniref:TraC family protein n=1 Tax=Peteryoungia ipomoeae TaxID=1210932 RepID=A0A4S8P0F7_9HYPH|nr:conjugal transfer protein TraC [Peteryoungia ipomoeae]THV20919.1 TraC family protein [Peteryoungia ipomoeae]